MPFALLLFPTAAERFFRDLFGNFPYAIARRSSATTSLCPAKIRSKISAPKPLTVVVNRSKIPCFDKVRRYGRLCRKRSQKPSTGD